ncbi:MAG: AmmeMemoRadiSam system protein B [Candidatus Methanofastidiosia archaeon]|jgi:AmmeMemoRadiSam system protein B/AmmeMemoRadiSam system protein A
MKKLGIAILIIVVVGAGIVVFWPERVPEERLPDVPEEEKLEEKIIRKAAVAGRFYPGSSDELKTVVEQYLNQAPYLNLPPVQGLVCPHAGYMYSGPVAAYSYKQLDNVYDTIILLGPSHYVPVPGASIPECTHYQTPLGLVKVSPLAKTLKKESLFTTVPAAHIQEHCLEVQLPFLQMVLTDFEIVPIIIGDADPQELALLLSPYIDDSTLVIASSDLSHYHSYEKACTLDKICTDAVPELDFEKIELCEACGIKALQTLMYIAENKDWQGELLDYRNSGDTSQRKDQVVGYMAAAFYGGDYVNEEDQHFLLELARKTLEQYLQNGTFLQVDESKLSDTLKEERACFVTLNKNGMLRGCIGSLTPEHPLYQGVMQNAVYAALQDPRFPPVQYQELSEITIEISVLTVPKQITYSSQAELLQKIERKGVIISEGAHRATYLPQVWDQLPDPEEFISNLCRKAGLSPDYWKEGTLEVYVYTAHAFEEE